MLFPIILVSKSKIRGLLENIIFFKFLFSSLVGYYQVQLGLANIP